MLSPVDMRLATLPMDTGSASRVDRTNRDHWREATAAALIQAHHAPVNIVGGNKFAGAPTIDIRPPVPAYGDVLTSPDLSAPNRPIESQHQSSQK